MPSASPIGLDDIAIDPYGALPQHLEIHHRPQRAADQPLDFMRPSANRPRADSRGSAFPWTATSHTPRSATLTAVTAKWRYTLFNARRADHFRIPNLDENRALGVFIEVTCETHGRNSSGCRPSALTHLSST